MNESLILTLCLQENTLLISNAIIEQLGSPSLIQIRMNEADKSLLVNPCEYGVRGAVVVPNNHMYQLEMPDRSLIRRIRRITEWPDDNPRVLCGVFIPQHNAIYFSLETAQYAILQPVPGSHKDPLSDSATDTVATDDTMNDDTTNNDVTNDNGRNDDTTNNDTTNDDAVASTLPQREGPEAVAPTLTDEGNDATIGYLENNDITEALFGGEDGDLNG